MSNVIVAIPLGKQHPNEIVKYTFELSNVSAFTGTNPETLTASASWKVVTTSDTDSDLSATMVHATDYSNTTNQKSVSVEIKNGTDGTSYYVVGLLTVSSGRKYFVAGKLTFTDIGIDIRWS